MTCVLARISAVLLLSAVVLCSGCLPEAGLSGDDQKDPQFVKGKALVNSMDYDGAIEAFQKALIENPKSAAAHFELGVLFEQQKRDWAAAIYHFERHLALQPDSALADIVRQRIMSCKVEIAKTVAFYLRSPQVQREFERLNAENQSLREQLDKTKAEIARLTAAATATSERPQERTGATGTAGGASGSTSGGSLAANGTGEAGTASGRLATGSRHSSSGPLPATYVIQPRDTLFSIATRYGLKWTEVAAANPGVDPRHLRPGQTLRIPARSH